MAGKNQEPQDISFPDQKIVDINLEHEMQTAYIEYAMSVIVGRALPDVRDGLKPVHRRILYSMYENGLTSDKAFKKSATCVGDVLGKYHPHGDTSVYDALVRLAQDFSMRYPLVEGHGNFGSVDGDPPAAYRYTEARMARLCNEMMRDIDKDTVDWDPNFDESCKEPRVVPSRFPNLLVNGSSGIAVGMTTNIPPHNLREVINACLAVLDDPEISLQGLMEHLPGPDFPTRGIILGRSGIRNAYQTGRGHIKLRARAEIEEFAQNRQRIIVTELPYQVNKARLVENIAEHVKNKNIDGISGLRDESDGKKGMRIVIELKRDANAQVVLNQLYANTQMQITFGVVLLALVNNQKQPKVLTLREILDEYLAFQEEVLTRRTRFDLKKAEERAHLLEGLLIALDNIDEVIKTIRESYDDAKQNLMARFDLSEVQAQAILDMQLRRLQGLEKEKLEAEYQEIEKKIQYYHELLENESMMRDLLKSELQSIAERYGDERRTEIQDVEDEIGIEDLIEEEQSVFTLSNAGYIKRMSVDTYRAQHRGGRGISGQSLKEEDFVKNLFTGSTHDQILFFTSTGRLHRRKGYQVPSSSRAARGTAIVNLLPLDPGETVTAMLPISLEDDSEMLFFVTKFGKVKKMYLRDLDSRRTMGIRAVNLDEGDELISAFQTTGSDWVIMATRNGRVIVFDENDVRPMGRTAAGMRGISLEEDDIVIGAEKYREGCQLLTVTERGYGKRTPIEDYLRHSDDGSALPIGRGGKGLKNMKLSEKTGPIAAVRVVSQDDDLILVESGGTVIRMSCAGVSVYSRGTQGVILMRLQDDAKVVSVERVDPSEETEEDLMEPADADPAETGTEDTESEETGGES